MSADTTPESIRHRRTIEDVGFVMLYHAITFDPQLSDGAKLTYVALLSHAQQKTYCWPGIEKLAKERGKCAGTISRHLLELRERGLITREPWAGTSWMTYIEDANNVYAAEPWFVDLLAQRDTSAQKRAVVARKNARLKRAKMRAKGEQGNENKLTLTPKGVVTEKPLQTHVEKEESVGVRESLSTEESISFTTPPPRQKRTAQDVREGAVRAIAKFEKKHRGDNGIDPAWRNVPVHQGQILTEFTRLSGISIPKTKRLRDSATYAAEVLYQETGSAAECVRRMQSFFAERAGGQEHQFAIADLNSIVKTICAMSAADAGPKVIRLGQ